MYKVKGSKHFAFAYPVQSEEQIKEHLDELRKEHYAARHHCYAWRLGADHSRYRANDDGEPNNSAGKPILGQIQSFELTNVLIVVIRYFGGTKLGVGGLIDAYRTAARMAIEQGKIIESVVENYYALHFPYSQMSNVMSLLKDRDLPQYDQEFDLTCDLNTNIRLSESEAFEEAIENLEGVKLKLRFTA
jgi:uncharacterized YigZ family protein